MVSWFWLLLVLLIGFAFGFVSAIIMTDDNKDIEYDERQDD